MIGNYKIITLYENTKFKNIHNTTNYNRFVNKIQKLNTTKEI